MLATAKHNRNKILQLFGILNNCLWLEYIILGAIKNNLCLCRGPLFYIMELSRPLLELVVDCGRAATVPNTVFIWRPDSEEQSIESDCYGQHSFFKFYFIFLYRSNLKLICMF